jgi:hypothetical protein
MPRIPNGAFRGFLRSRLSHDLFLSDPSSISPFDVILHRKVTDKENNNGYNKRLSFNNVPDG